MLVLPLYGGRGAAGEAGRAGAGAGVAEGAGEVNNVEYVRARLAHGSLCQVCPLNGQRKVGCDGDARAKVYGIAEAPGEDEERWGKARGARYGTPLVGKTGYRLRIENMAPADLVTVIPDPQRSYPRLSPPRAFLTNVVMCRPPKNKIDSPVGRLAVRCCANSLRWFLRERLAEDPDRTIIAIGGTALSVLRGRKSKIDAHRGRVRHYARPLEALAKALTPEPEFDIMKAALRGRKPKEEWWPRFEKTLKGILRMQRAGVTRASKRVSPEYAGVLAIVKLIVTKQRAALRKARG